MSAVTAFDADVSIYAAAQGHPVGARVAELFAGVYPDGLPAAASEGSARSGDLTI